MDPGADEEPDTEALARRVEQLEAEKKQIKENQAEQREWWKKALPDRRGVIKGLGAAALGGAAVGGATGGASGQSAAGQVGTASEPVDVFAYDLDVQGALQRDLDAGGQAIENAGSVSTKESRSDLLAANQRLDAVFDALRIRRRAGIPESETVGLSDSGALTAESQIVIGSETNASSVADSGSGTESDPYIIRDRDLDNSEAASGAGFEWTQVGADYFIELRNCRINGYNRCINKNANSGLTVVNCDLGSSTSDNIINFEGSITVKNSDLHDAEDDGIDHRFAPAVTVEDTLIRSADGFGINKQNGVAEVRRAEVTSTTQGRLISITGGEDNVVERCKLTQSHSDTSAATSESVCFVETNNSVMRECWSVENLCDDAFELVRATDTEIAHCVGDDTFESVADVFASNAQVGYDHVHHIYGNNTGSVQAIAVNDMDYTVVNDIYVSAPDGDGIRINADNCTVIGPVPLAGNVGGERINDIRDNSEILLFTAQTVADINNNIPDDYTNIR